MTGETRVVAVVRLPGTVPVLIRKRTEVPRVVLVGAAAKLRVGAVVWTVFQVILGLGHVSAESNLAFRKRAQTR